MKSKHHNFHDPRYSMLLSGINNFIKKESNGVKGMNANHEMVSAMTRVIKKRESKAETGFIHWISQLITKLLLFFKKDQKGLLDDCMEILLEYKLLKLAGKNQEADEKKDELKFSQCDPRWVEAVLVWIDTYVIHHEKAAYVKYKQLDDFAYKIPDKDLKVGLIADWGTGEEEAEAVLDQLFTQKPDLILHLGDIYYSGTEEEYQDNYLDVIERCRIKHNTNTPVYNLPGNHDYYSGGRPFFDFLSKTNQKSDYPQQEASYFLLGNSSWQLHGMDTGHNDRNVFEVGKDITHLQSKEVTWHHHHLDKGLANDKRMLLFSHHQLFSRFLNIGKRSHNKHLHKHFESYLGKVSGWFWGHEHLLEIYKPFLGLEKGRCIGYGAVPIIYDEGNPYKATAKYKGSPISPLPDIIPESVVSNNGDIYANGFVMLDLKMNKEGQASYYSILPDEELKLVYQEAL